LPEGLPGRHVDRQAVHAVGLQKGGHSLLPLPLQCREELLEVFPLAQGIEIGVVLHVRCVVVLLKTLQIEMPVVVSPSMSVRYSLPLVTGEPARVAGFVAVAPVAISMYRERLSQIQAPVLAIWGENDQTVPLEQADLLVKSVPRGRFKRECKPEKREA
jgi:hypothetical protein